MKLRAVERLVADLSERDIAVLASLERFRLLSSRHLQRLHFTDHATDRAAARACSRCLRRLTDLGLIASLARRIGGTRMGSASLVWQLAATGERFLRAVRGDTRRRRFVEPGSTFLNHTLAVNDLAVGLLEADRTHRHLTIDTLDTEPANWRRFLGGAGEARWLKPDLHVVITALDDQGAFEQHDFLEIDLGTESSSRVRAKCQIYLAYAATRRYQTAHDVFPVVHWISADPTRREALQSAVRAIPEAPAEMFQVISPDAYLDAVAAIS